MMYEITTVVMGGTSTWTIEAVSVADARRKATQEIKRVYTQFSIVGIRPVGFKQKRDIAP